MKRARLQALLERCAQLTVLVVGDFFLDKYLHIDEALAEPSLETGLVAHQVVRVTCSPGAAGTVAVNLRALGVHVRAMGVAGVDGEGHDLMQALAANAIDTTHLLQVPGLRTPAYYKPMLHNATEARELNRMDIKNRTALPDAVQAELCNRLRLALQDVQGVIVADQVVQPECGVIGSRMRTELTAAAAAHSQLVFAVDSRARIGSFRNMLLKPNQHEALAATGREPTATDLKSLVAAGAELQASSGRAVCVTLGERGALLCTPTGAQHIAARSVAGPTDAVGAGDAFMAALTAALCAGAEEHEAVELGNLAASITVAQVGTTGSANIAQLLGGVEA